MSWFSFSILSWAYADLLMLFSVRPQRLCCLLFCWSWVWVQVYELHDGRGQLQGEKPCLLHLCPVCAAENAGERSQAKHRPLGHVSSCRSLSQVGYWWAKWIYVVFFVLNFFHALFTDLTILLVFMNLPIHHSPTRDTTYMASHGACVLVFLVLVETNCLHMLDMWGYTHEYVLSVH